MDQIDEHQTHTYLRDKLTLATFHTKYAAVDVFINQYELNDNVVQSTIHDQLKPYVPLLGSILLQFKPVILIVVCPLLPNHPDISTPNIPHIIASLPYFLPWNIVPSATSYVTPITHPTLLVLLFIRQSYHTHHEYNLNPQEI